jgi:predicted acetyltransferase
MIFKSCSRQTFIDSLSGEKVDSFEKTFKSKADMMDIWDVCYGCFNDNNELMGAIITTIGKKKPITANLQLLFTFNKHRKKGVGKFLVENSFKLCYESGVEYLRVSCEQDAINFYENIGFKMLGEQKSGCQLSMCKIKQTIKQSDFSINQKHILKTINRNGKGGCVKIFNGQDGLTLVNIMGSNATGKSTRVRVLVDWLDMHFESKIFQYQTPDKGVKPLGLLYEKLGLLIIGKKTSSSWVGLDAAVITKQQETLDFYKMVSEKHKNIHTILQEGYFSNRSPQRSPNNVRRYGIDICKIYAFYYDSIDDYLERTNTRSGKLDRGMDWAENSRGWQENSTIKNMFIRYQEDCLPIDKVERVDINAPKTFFIKELFGVDVNENDIVVEVAQPKVEHDLDSW